MSQYDFQKWTEATAALSWGAQRVLHETLQSVAQNNVHLTYGADYNDGRPCLINAAATMLSAIGGEGGRGKPSAYFGDVVAEFDNINRFLADKSVNTEPYTVSPLAAEILLANFAPLKEQPETPITESVSTMPYREPSDEDFARDWIIAATTEPAVELSTPLVEEQHEPSVEKWTYVESFD